MLLVKLKDGETATKEEFLDFLQGKIAKWWMPDDVSSSTTSRWARPARSTRS
jgi:hypothetical protein